MGFFDIFRKKQDTPPSEEQVRQQRQELDAGLEKTKTGLFSKLARAVAGRSTVDAAVLDDLEEVLISSDVGVETTVKIIRRIEERAARDKYMNASELQSILREEVAALMEEAHGSSGHFGLDATEGTPYVVMVVGVNGAGKTTTMHAISGLLKLQSGEIDYCGQTISKMEAHKIIRLGLAQVPEGRRVFSGLTVQQNLQMGAYTRRDGKEAIQNDFDMVFDLLPRLKERRNQPAGTLSGGEQQMLAMGRALMCKPKMLLLDEPSMGLSPLLVKEIFKIIRQVNRNGVTVLLVEQNAKMALEIANRAYVLETGTIKMEGEATELANNIEVRKAYLGCE